MIALKMLVFFIVFFYILSILNHFDVFFYEAARDMASCPPFPVCLVEKWRL